MVEENSVSENNYFLKDLDKIKIGQIVNLEGILSI